MSSMTGLNKPRDAAQRKRAARSRTADADRAGLADRATDRLRAAGLRPTRQRRAIYALLFGGGNRHVTAERLHGEAAEAGLRISLATIYNTLHQFRRAGLVRQIPVDAGRTYFDTNPTDHLHFLDADSGTLVDGPTPVLAMDLDLPAGVDIEGIDVIVRVRSRATG